MITITFDLENHGEDGLIQLNRLLSTMKLEDLRINDVECYLCTSYDTRGKVLGHHFGLSRGQLLCRLAEDGDVYQIDLCMAPKTIPDKEYVKSWSNRHPDHQVRFVQVRTLRSLKDQYAYLILYHPKDSSPLAADESTD